MRTILRSALVTLLALLVLYATLSAQSSVLISRTGQGWLVGAASDGADVLLGADGVGYLKITPGGDISTVGDGILRAVKQAALLVTTISGQDFGTINWNIAGSTATTSLASAIIAVENTGDLTARQEALHVYHKLTPTGAISQRKAAGLFHIENTGTQNHSSSARALYLDASHRSTGTLAELAAVDAFATNIEGAGTLTEMAGGRFQAALAGSTTNVTTLRALRAITSLATGAGGTATIAYGVYAQVTNAGAAGDITEARGVSVLIENTSTSGTVPTSYGVYVANSSMEDVNTTNSYGYYAGDIQGTNKWSFYNADTDAPIFSLSPIQQGGANGQLAAEQTATTSVTCSSGATCTATNLIPAGSVVYGVTIRVTTAITGATSISIGDGTDADRWGASIAVAVNTTTTGADFTITSVPIYPAATNVVLTAGGGTFSGGVVRLSVHYKSFTAATS